MRVFRAAGPCWTGDCPCRTFDGLPEERAPRPPVHDDCARFLWTPPEDDDPSHASVLLRPDAEGFLYRRELGDRLIGVMPLLFGAARLGIGPLDSDGFDDVWDYPSAVRAVAEARTWNPDADPEPAGWHRHPGSGRRRPDGDPTRERKSDDDPGTRNAKDDDDPGSRDREESA